MITSGRGLESQLALPHPRSAPRAQAAIAQLTESLQRNQEALATLAKQQAEMTAIRTAEKEASRRALGTVDPMWQKHFRQSVNVFVALHNCFCFPMHIAALTKCAEFSMGTAKLS